MKYRGGVLIAAVMLAAAPAHAQDAEADYRAGVAARLAGEPETALERLRRAAAAEPENADIHLQIGLAALAADRLEEAEASFLRTLELAPDYADARVGLARVAQRNGDRAGARAQLAQVPPTHAEADDLRRSLSAEPAPGRWRVDAGAAYTAVDQAEDWKEATFGVARTWRSGTTFGLSVQGAQRFGREDVHVEARVDQRVGPGTSLYGLVGATPDADFLPEWRLGAGASVRVTEGPNATVATIDGRLAGYETSNVAVLTPGIEQYLGGKAWLSAQWINVFEDGDHAGGWRLRGDLMASERIRVFAGAADAPDLSQGIVVDTFSIFGGIATELTDQATMHLSVARDEPDAGRDRTTFALGLSWRL